MVATARLSPSVTMLVCVCVEGVNVVGLPLTLPQATLDALAAMPDMLIPQVPVAPVPSSLGEKLL